MDEKVRKEEMNRTPLKGLHPENPHNRGYPFEALVQSSSGLGAYVQKSPAGTDTIDFSSSRAVKELNQALLRYYYGIDYWDIPPDSLCPPVPGRLDYLLYMADLLHEWGDPSVSKGKKVKVLDIGTGANLIYPILGHRKLGWRLVGSEISEVSLKWAKILISVNSNLRGGVEVRLQPNQNRFFRNVVKSGESFTFSICNPPFYASQKEALDATNRKWTKLGKIPTTDMKNFGGTSNELWTAGGEENFIREMIKESKQYFKQFGWFSSLVSKSATAGLLYHELRQELAIEAKVIKMNHGQKQVSVLAWRKKP